MPSKSLDIKIRILLFIICSIGILYISMRLFYKPIEGFSVVNNCYLDTTTFPTIEAAPNRPAIQGMRIWECLSEVDAVSLLNNTSARLIDTDQICFPTPNPTMFTSNYFICYKRPAGKSFNFRDGVYFTSNSLTDDTPYEIKNDIKQICSDFGGQGARFESVLSNVSSTRVIISEASAYISSTTGELVKLSTTYCTPPIIDTKFTNFCTTLNRGIGIYESLPRGNRGLNYISTTITENIYASTVNLKENIYQKAYKGFQCASDEDDKAERSEMKMV